MTCRPGRSAFGPRGSSRSRTIERSAWKRSAIGSDAEWVKKAMRLFAWMTPGEVEVYGLDQEAEARAWVAA